MLVSGCITDIFHMKTINKLPQKQIVKSEEKTNPPPIDNKKEKDQLKFPKNEQTKTPPPEEIAEEKLTPAPDPPEKKNKDAYKTKKIWPGNA